MCHFPDVLFPDKETCNQPVMNVIFFAYSINILYLATMELLILTKIVNYNYK